MDSRQAFKFAFLQRCLEEGLTPAQTTERIMKCAALDASKVLEWLGNAVGTAGRAGTGAMWASVPITAGVGLGTGLLGGAALAKAMDPGYDPSELNRQELISTYDTLSGDMEEKRKAREEVGL